MNCVEIPAQTAANILMLINFFLLVGIVSAIFTRKLGNFEKGSLVVLFALFLAIINYFAFFMQGC